jgi:hypothetical protein
MREKVKVLYVAGWGRSGSTILTNILGQVDGLVSVGEVNFLWKHGLIENRLCGCGAPFRECPEWTEVLNEAFGGGNRIDPHRMVRLQGAGARTRHVPLMLTSWGRRRLKSRLREYLNNLGRLYEAIRDSTGSRVIVDSSKFPSYGYTLGMVPNVELYVVHLVRDPRAVAYSWLKKKVQPPSKTGEFGYMHRYDPVKSSLMWGAWNLSAEMLWRRYPERYMRLRYEDFVGEPRETIERILGMVQEPATRLPFAGERVAELGASHTISGNPNRFRTGTVKLRPDEEWASRMKPGDRALVTLLTFPLLARYRYPVATGNVLAG